MVPDRLDFLNELYWPIVIVLCVCFLATLYHVSVPVRTSWRFNLPGAALTMVDLVFGSYLLRWVLTAHGEGVDVDLRPAVGADRGDAVALPALHRGAGRGGPQRRLRPALAREGDRPGPDGVGTRLRLER